MAWPLIAAAAMQTAETVGNNIMSEWHADKAQERQKELANMQFSHNQALQRAAMSNQVQGAKLAGLNPAMFNGQTSPAQSVSQGSAPKGENVEMNQTSPADMLTMAQVKNLEAQTEKTEAETNKISGVETENIKSDTALKTAQTLFSGANQEKIAAETKSIQNVNDQFELEKAGTALFGQAMAQDWQKQPWYSKLTSGQKMIVDDIANGELDLYPGTMVALVKSVKANSDMSSMQKNQLADAMAQVLTRSQMKDKKVMEALAKMPEKTRAKLEAEINESYKRAANMELENKWTKDRYDVYKGQDVDYLYNEYMKDPDNNEKAARWILATTNDKVNKLYDAARNAVPAYIGGRGFGSGMRGSRKAERGVNESSEHQKGPFYKYGLRDWTENEAGANVSDMKK